MRVERTPAEHTPAEHTAAVPAVCGALKPEGLMLRTRHRSGFLVVVRV